MAWHMQETWKDPPSPPHHQPHVLLYLWLRQASRNRGRKRWRRTGERQAMIEMHKDNGFRNPTKPDSITSRHKNKAHTANKSPESFADVSQACMNIKWSPVNQTVVCSRAPKQNRVWKGQIINWLRSHGRCQKASSSPHEKHTASAPRGEIVGEAPNGFDFSPSPSSYAHACKWTRAVNKGQ